MACALKELPGKLSYLNDVTEYQPECSVSSENESILWGGATLDASLWWRVQGVEVNSRRPRLLWGTVSIDMCYHKKQ